MSKEDETGPSRGKVCEFVSRVLTATNWEGLESFALKRVLKLTHTEFAEEFPVYLENGPDRHEPLFKFAFNTLQFDPLVERFYWERLLAECVTGRDFSRITAEQADELAGQPFSCGYIDFARNLSVQRMHAIAPIRCLKDLDAYYLLARLIKSGQLDTSQKCYLGTEIVKELYCSSDGKWHMYDVDYEDDYEAGGRFFFSAVPLEQD